MPKNSKISISILNNKYIHQIIAKSFISVSNLIKNLIIRDGKMMKLNFQYFHCFIILLVSRNSFFKIIRDFFQNVTITCLNTVKS